MKWASGTQPASLEVQSKLFKFHSPKHSHYMGLTTQPLLLVKMKFGLNAITDMLPYNASVLLQRKINKHMGTSTDTAWAARSVKPDCNIIYIHDCMTSGMIHRGFHYGRYCSYICRTIFAVVTKSNLSLTTQFAQLAGYVCTRLCDI